MLTCTGQYNRRNISEILHKNINIGVEILYLCYAQQKILLIYVHKQQHMILLLSEIYLFLLCMIVSIALADITTYTFVI